MSNLEDMITDARLRATCGAQDRAAFYAVGLFSAGGRPIIAAGETEEKARQGGEAWCRCRQWAVDAGDILGVEVVRGAAANADAVRAFNYADEPDAGRGR